MLRELAGFIRFTIAFFLGILGAAGFIIYNPATPHLAGVFVSSFLLVASTYSYNNITDKAEDLLNRKRINYFVYYSMKGRIISFLLFTAGGVISYFLGSTPFVLYALLGVMGYLYSYRKIKRILLVKNIYTTLLSGIFMLGASVSSPISREIIFFTAALAFLFFIGSLLSDLRDMKGDAAAGIRTIPVVFGYEKAKFFLLILINIFFSIAVIFQIRKLYVFSFFLIPVIEFLSIQKIHHAHKMIQYSFLLSFLWWL